MCMNHVCCGFGMRIESEHVTAAHSRPASARSTARVTAGQKLSSGLADGRKAPAPHGVGWARGHGAYAATRGNIPPGSSSSCSRPSWTHPWRRRHQRERRQAGRVVTAALNDRALPAGRNRLGPKLLSPVHVLCVVAMVCGGRQASCCCDGTVTNCTSSKSCGRSYSCCGDGRRWCVSAARGVAV